jgi:RND family efflux transporter MFP subunit
MQSAWKHFSGLVGSAFVLGAAMSGCARPPMEAPPMTPPTIQVSYPIEQEITDYVDFTGRTAAVDSVEVRARVWGYLDKVNFKEGALVKKGDELFKIDPRTYQAALNQAEGNLASMEARLKRQEADYARAQRLIKNSALSREDYDKIEGDRQESLASLTALRAAVQQAKLDLEFTRVVAPVNGRVGRALVTEGNMIQSGQLGGTLLTTIMSVDPMYVYFDMDERTVLRVQQLARDTKTVKEEAPPTNGKNGSLWLVPHGVPVFLGLANQTGFPHEGTIDFVDNQINPKTGTLRVRGVFPNKDESLTPGLFGRVRVPLGNPHQAVLVSDRAIDADQGQKILYVVDKDHKVTSRPIRVGGRHGRLRVIEEGLKPGELVVVNGLQQIRPGVVIDPKVETMPGQNANAKLEARNNKSEIRNTKSETSSKSEIQNPKSASPKANPEADSGATLLSKSRLNE